MSQKRYSRRRRSGVRFRPSSGMAKVSKKDQREADLARAEAVSDSTMTDRVYAQRHSAEIDRAQNVAAGLPPNLADEQIQPAAETSPAPATPKQDLDATSAPEKPFEPVPVAEPKLGAVPP